MQNVVSEEKAMKLAKCSTIFDYLQKKKKKESKGVVRTTFNLCKHKVQHQVNILDKSEKQVI